MLDYDIEKFTINEDLLNKLAELNPIFAKNIDVKTVMSAQIIKKALLGDLSAIAMIRQQIGEEPTQQINQTNTNINIEDEKVIKQVIDKVKDL